MLFKKDTYAIRRKEMLLEDELEPTHRLLPPPEPSVNDVEIKATSVYPSSDLIKKIPGIDDYCDTDNLNPESVDIPLTEFQDHRGKLTPPFEIAPNDFVYAKSPLKPKLEEDEFACIETRSNSARSFLMVPGFYAKDISDGLFSGKRRYTPYLSWEESFEDGMVVYLYNGANVPYVIDKVPIFPFQMTISVREYMPKSVIQEVRLFQDGQDVSDDRLSEEHDLHGYYLTLSPEVWWMESIKGARIRYSERKHDASNLFHEDDIREIDVELLGNPSLTVSREKIMANTPAYVYPTHVRSPRYWCFGFPCTSTSSGRVKNIMLDRIDEMLITGNAGLIHYGTNNVTVFENLPSHFARHLPEQLKEFFKVDEPFGYVIPVPLKETDKDVKKYRGTSWNQEGICINHGIERNNI